MDDVRALQDACLRDRQERDQWHHAFLAEQDKCKNLEVRLDNEAEYAAKLVEAVTQRRRTQHSEISAVMSYQKTLLELTALQQAHLVAQQANCEEVEALRNLLAEARRLSAGLASELEAERAGRASDVAGLAQQLHARAVAATAEVAELHESYGGRLSLLEDFKNQLLADKAAAEERWSRERAALQAQQAASAAAAAAGGGAEAMWKSRLMRLRAEMDVVRRERDAAHAAMRAAGMAPPPPMMPQAPASVTATGASGGGAGAAVGGGPGAPVTGVGGVAAPSFQSLQQPLQPLPHAQGLATDQSQQQNQTPFPLRHVRDGGLGGPRMALPAAGQPLRPGAVGVMGAAGGSLAVGAAGAAGQQHQAVGTGAGARTAPEGAGLAPRKGRLGTIR